MRLLTVFFSIVFIHYDAFAGQPLDLGVGNLLNQSPYAGSDSSTKFVPLIRYDGENFYAKFNRIGLHLFNSEELVFDLGFSSGFFNGINHNEFGADELTRNGINRDLLDDRDSEIDFQASVEYKNNTYGDITFRLNSDIDGKGNSTQIFYQYPFRIGSVRFVPGIGGRYVTPDLADYYFGISDKEVGRGLNDYTPGSMFISEFRLGMVLPFKSGWAASGGIRYNLLPQELTDSPLIDADINSVFSASLGISRRF